MLKEHIVKKYRAQYAALRRNEPLVLSDDAIYNLWSYHYSGTRVDDAIVLEHIIEVNSTKIEE